jgi:predicted membrane-bound mannosyltransferase
MMPLKLYNSRFMKKNMITVFIFTIVLTAGISQDGLSQKRMKYIPEHGFWQLVSNIHEDNFTIVRFYNDNKELIHEEKLMVKLHPEKIKTLRYLKKELDKALLAWNRQKQPLPDKGWIVSINDD